MKFIVYLLPVILVHSILPPRSIDEKEDDLELISFDPCDNKFFWISKDDTFTAVDAGDVCPSGYELANIKNEELFEYAKQSVFKCLGSESAAWIAGSPSVLSNSKDPLILYAPNAIEKSHGPVYFGDVGKINPEKIQNEFPVLCLMNPDQLQVSYSVSGEMVEEKEIFSYDNYSSISDDQSIISKASIVENDIRDFGRLSDFYEFINMKFENEIIEEEDLYSDHSDLYDDYSEDFIELESFEVDSKKFGLNQKCLYSDSAFTEE